MKKVLVVDDDLEQRDLYAELFRENQFEVIEGEDGLDGFNKAIREKPDLVFTGIMMPRMNGFELAKGLRKNPDTAKIPVMIFSHLGRKEDRERAEILGLLFMVKGFNSPAEILRRAGELVLAGATRVNAAERPTPPAQGAEISEDEVNRILKNLQWKNLGDQK